jgi:C1A family cysteine protease
VVENEFHALLIIGWKWERKGKKRTCFYVVNTWGESWGKKGYIWYCLERPTEMLFNREVQK